MSQGRSPACIREAMCVLTSSTSSTLLLLPSSFCDSYAPAPAVSITCTVGTHAKSGAIDVYIFRKSTLSVGSSIWNHLFCLPLHCCLCRPYSLFPQYQLASGRPRFHRPKHDVSLMTFAERHGNVRLSVLQMVFDCNNTLRLSNDLKPTIIQGPRKVVHNVTVHTVLNCQHPCRLRSKRATRTCMRGYKIELVERKSGRNYWA